MKSLRFLLMKEFRQIFRNKAILPLIFVMPVIQLLVMPLAADYEIRNINIAVVDHDHSVFSQQLIRKIIASGYFRLQGKDDNYKSSFRHIELDQADLILELPHDFEKSLMLQNRSKVFIAINAINGVKANLGGQYLTTILSNYSKELHDRVLPEGTVPETPTIEVENMNQIGRAHV